MLVLKGSEVNIILWDQLSEFSESNNLTIEN